MSIFTNNFGTISLEKNTLCINLEITDFTRESLVKYLEAFESSYKEINYNFIIIADLSKINVIDIPKKFYDNIAALFLKYYQISENYLQYIIVISPNVHVRNILNALFTLYKTPHPFFIIKKKERLLDLYNKNSKKNILNCNNSIVSNNKV